ncbi:MAG: hypothetical protein JW942_07845 [Opitutales bacterium]|nr:hypothetical protein [Opitutales bacterium]
MGAFFKVILRFVPWIVTAATVVVQILRGFREVGTYVLIGFLCTLGAVYGPKWAEALASLAFPSLTSDTSSAVATALGMANWIFPVTETFGMLTVYIPLASVVVFIRIYKSLIPTVG